MLASPPGFAEPRPKSPKSPVTHCSKGGRSPCCRATTGPVLAHPLGIVEPNFTTQTHPHDRNLPKVLFHPPPLILPQTLPPKHTHIIGTFQKCRFTRFTRFSRFSRFTLARLILHQTLPPKHTHIIGTFQKCRFTLARSILPQTLPTKHTHIIGTFLKCRFTRFSRFSRFTLARLILHQTLPPKHTHIIRTF